MEIHSLARLKSITPAVFWKFHIFAQRMPACTSVQPKTAEDEMWPEGNFYFTVRTTQTSASCFTEMIANVFNPNHYYLFRHYRGIRSIASPIEIPMKLLKNVQLKYANEPLSNEQLDKVQSLSNFVYVKSVFQRDLYHNHESKKYRPQP